MIKLKLKNTEKEVELIPKTESTYTSLGLFTGYNEYVKCGFCGENKEIYRSTIENKVEIPKRRCESVAIINFDKPYKGHYPIFGKSEYYYKISPNEVRARFVIDEEAKPNEKIFKASICKDCIEQLSVLIK